MRGCSTIDQFMLCKNTLSIGDTNQVMLYMLRKEITTVSSEKHRKHISALCGKNAELLALRHGVHAAARRFKW
jgi:hypothetical protein